MVEYTHKYNGWLVISRRAVILSKTTQAIHTSSTAERDVCLLYSSEPLTVAKLIIQSHAADGIILTREPKERGVSCSPSLLIWLKWKKIASIYTVS